MSQIQQKVLCVSDCNLTELNSLLEKFQLKLHIEADNIDIPGSYWGESEAGLINNNIYARIDTPIHSLLHESCHYICMDSQRRKELNTDAAGDYDEENAVCYLQIILSEFIPELGRNRMMQDMDTWGYTFRLGTAKQWFENDAEDALDWLLENKLLDHNHKPTFKLRS